MAKIYETQADFEKEVLEKQAQELRMRAETQNKASWMMLAGALLADVWNLTKRVPSRVLSVAGWAMFIGSVVETFKSWQTHNRAHDLELKRERLGPETAVLPPGENDKEKEDCGCKTKYAAPKTLLEQALRSDLPLSRE